jgi:hypothetical protein
LIDFEKAIKEHGTDFHGAHGYSARSGDTTKDGQMDHSDKRGEDAYERVEDPMHRAIRIQLEKEQEAKDAHISKTGETDPITQEQTATERAQAHPYMTINVKAPPRASETCIPESVVDNVAPSCASLVSERGALPTHEEDTTSESGHVKDEL